MWQQQIPFKPVARLACVFLLSACADAVGPSGLRPGQPAAAPLSQPLTAYNAILNPWGTYDEIYASSQAPEADDGVRWRCPEEPALHKTWRLTLTVEQLPGVNDPDYLAHFTFSEGKYFIGYVGRSAGGLPLADYRFYETAYSHDRRFVARPYGRLTLMCRGTYTRMPAARVWSGQYWVVAHEGTIDLGPAYVPWPGGGGNGGGCGGPGHYLTGAGGDAAISDAGYDPYASSPSCGDDGGGGSGPGSPDGQNFAELCSSLNGRLYYDFACLELWNEKTGDYQTVWCGTAAFCET
jgi:hypothetical protein